MHSDDTSSLTASKMRVYGAGDSPTVSSHDGYEISSKSSSSGSNVVADHDIDRFGCSKGNVSPDTVDVLRRNPLKISAYKSKEQRAEIASLTREVESYKHMIAKLQSEAEQVAEFTSRHVEELEAEFEEKVSLYEDEVLALKQELTRTKQENQELKNNAEAAEKAHQKQLKAIQKGVQKTQVSHRDYLDKIMVLLEDTEVARKCETDRIREEVDSLKRDRDSQIACLKEEIALLRSLGFGAKNQTNCPPGSLTQGARKLSQKLRLAVSAENILRVVSEARDHSGSPQRYVDCKISSQAIKHVSYLEEMIQIADIEATEQAALAREEKRHLEELEVQLSQAYQEYGRLQRKGFI
jgi:DNA-binding ferritin-like protein (Dps family)